MVLLSFTPCRFSIFLSWYRKGFWSPFAIVKHWQWETKIDMTPNALSLLWLSFLTTRKTNGNHVTCKRNPKLTSNMYQYRVHCLKTWQRKKKLGRGLMRRNDVSRSRDTEPSHRAMYLIFSARSPKQTTIIHYWSQHVKYCCLMSTTANETVWWFGVANRSHLPIVPTHDCSGCRGKRKMSLSHGWLKISSMMKEAYRFPACALRVPVSNFVVTSKPR